jgi:Tol biopolymer transport system component
MNAKLCITALFLAITAVTASAEPSIWTPTEVSTEEYESSPTFSPDGQEMFFMRADKSFQNYRLMWSRCERTGWSKPVPPPFAATTPVLEADPFISGDGNRVYFVSSRHAFEGGRGNEDLDIWYSDRLPTGAWSAVPKRLPEPVNSTGSELLPRVTKDGSLYFGSSRPGGKGGSDIYVARLQPNGAWSVSNIDEVNSILNEYEADVSQDGLRLVLVADRGDRSHLYLFTRPSAQSAWIEQRRLPALPTVFQVGPLMSPLGDRVLFAQTFGRRSGEFFLLDLTPSPNKSWPPTCPKKALR